SPIGSPAAGRHLLVPTASGTTDLAGRYRPGSQAVASSAARRSSARSEPAGPTRDSPAGSPSAVVTGTDTAGSPASTATDVTATVARRTASAAAGSATG